jgi:hypothetical protein
MRLNKKAQGLGGLITVLVLGIIFFAFFPFFFSVFTEVASLHTPVLGGLIILCIFIVVYFFIRFAFNLGAD